ncbi:MAG: chorismate-binding protein [bacterium]
MLNPQTTKKPFAIIKRKEDDKFLFFEGNLVELDKLSDIPRKSGKGEFHTLSIIPFSQIKERGFSAHDDGAKILRMEIEKQTRHSAEEIFKFLPSEQIVLDGDVRYNYTEKEYGELIKNVVENEIGNGEGANFVIPRKGEVKIKDFFANKALTVFRNILESEQGSYWTFLFFTGKQYFIGATPERHIAVKDKRVTMNPISGTFRKKGFAGDLKTFEKDFLKFLSDKKEINELFMVVDEELKMMADICENGGMIIGPLLKEMSQLIHTEYLLSGKSDKDIIDIFCRSMFAATVTGSPVENACRIIKKYEKESRRYYGSALVLIGKDDNGGDILDSPITIRTFEIDMDGNVLLRVGATLVRDSVPELEVEETKSKIQAMLNCIQNSKAQKPEMFLSKMGDDVNKILQRRNEKLSKFWFFNQQDEDLIVPQINGKKVVIIDNEDDFCFMLKHILKRMGLNVKVVRFSDYDFGNDDADITIVGAGTGNPNEQNNGKMKIISEIIDKLFKHRKRFFAVCLGHQMLCRHLGIKVEKKKNPSQGITEKIFFNGGDELVGFYNTFAGKYETDIEGVEIGRDDETKEINSLRGKNFFSFQFHPESILTQNGYEILRDALVQLIKRKGW